MAELETGDTHVPLGCPSALEWLVAVTGLLLRLALVAEFTRRGLRVAAVVVGRGVVAAVAAPVPRVVVLALSILSHQSLLVAEKADEQPVLGGEDVLQASCAFVEATQFAADFERADALLAGEGLKFDVGEIVSHHHAADTC